MAEAEAIVLSREGATASVARLGSGPTCCGGACRSVGRDCRAIAHVPVPPGWTLAPGDRVLLEISAGRLLYGVAAAWGIPGVALFAGTAVGALIPTTLGLPGWQGWGVVGAALGLGASTLPMRRLERRLRIDPRFRPRIARRLGRQSGDRAGFASTD